MADYDVKGVTFYPSYHKAIMRIPDDAMRLRAFEIVTTYMLTGEMPEDMDWQLETLFEGIKPNIDTSRKRSNAGQTTSNENQNEIKTKSKGKQTANNKNKNIRVEDKEELEDEKREENKKKEKHKHGEYAHVLLTDDELSKLEDEFGIDKTDKAIRFLDEYIEMKGAKYKSHYLAMRKWVFRAVEEQDAKNNRASPTDYWDELLGGGADDS